MLVCALSASLAPALAAADTAVPVPSSGQLRMMQGSGLSQFMHFSVNPFMSPGDPAYDTQHNCVNGSDSTCIPASVFSPSNLSTDQWAEAAVAMGADEICLTAHHEGGFALWDTKYSNYSVMHSPYGRDVVAQFVASCKKHGLRPCYYFPPNANGWFVTHDYSPEEFLDAQAGMLTELLTNYGNDYVSRLWWDHYGEDGGQRPGNGYASGGCWKPGTPKLGPNPVLCPYGAFPAAWPRFIELVRKLSPSTIICPGPDCDSLYQHSGLAGTYPYWYPCRATKLLVNGTNVTMGCRSKNHVESDDASLSFGALTHSASMHHGWFCNGPCEDDPEKPSHFWNASQIWQRYMATVGSGRVATLNAPPGTTGQIPQDLVRPMTQFGAALRRLLRPVTPSAEATGQSAPSCNDTVVAELDLGGAVEFNMVMSREDLSQGQRVTSYAIDYFSAGAWRTFGRGDFSGGGAREGVHGMSVGSRVVDFVPATTARKLRFRCVGAMATPVRLAGFSAHSGAGPDGAGI